VLAGLPANEKFLFKLDAQDASLKDHLKLQMLSRYGNETHFITVNDKEYFVFDRNQKGQSLQVDEKMPVIPVIYFAKNSSALDAESMRVLDQACDILKQHSDYIIDIHAHADARASDAFNDILTEKRMISARNYLITKGIDKKRVKGFYHGKKMLLIKCPDDKCSEEQHRQNRRTEFQFVKK
jgi:outer membrane protein OmpA-like peptidoglycan-associated protein